MAVWKKGIMSIQNIILLLVVIIATGVIISLVIIEAGKNRQRTMDLNQDVIGKIGGKALKVTEITAERAPTEEEDTASFLTIQAKLMPDSEFISLQRMHILVEGTELEKSYSFSTGVNCSIKDPSSNFSAYNQRNDGFFGAEFLLPSPNKLQPYTIAKSDVVHLCFKLPQAIAHDETLQLQIIPEGGVVFSIEQTIPQTLGERTTIYKRN